MSHDQSAVNVSVNMSVRHELVVKLVVDLYKHKKTNKRKFVVNLSWARRGVCRELVFLFNEHQKFVVNLS